ncbi:MAG: 2-amino-4-hydroxy-6-hydroxymethyldihydropteridine diphosphokinase [Thaumarchaeota archaeon]|nr:2-amino-4-hydroxy-6-hydroxymethyldihydropteridine diphosphokinase [Nitrososphaerota archaeon]
MVDVFIGLGSNVGDREGNLRKAIELLNEKMKLVKVSSMYETEPMYLKNQAWFVNCVAKLETDLTPKELLVYLEDIERKLGRQKSVRYGPRSIDLDILFYGNEVVEESDLKIPHPRIHERRFVLVPFVEIEPDHVHPIYGKSAATLLANLNSNEHVRKAGTISLRRK